MELNYKLQVIYRNLPTLPELLQIAGKAMNYVMNIMYDKLQYQAVPIALKTP